jgi:hypothetical protein
MFDKNKPMLLGDIFSNSFNLIGKTIGRNVVIASVFIIPAGIFMVLNLHSFIEVIAATNNSTTQNVAEYTKHDQLMSLLEGLSFFYFSLMIYGMANLAAAIGVTKIGSGAMEGERVTLKEAFAKIFSVTYLRSVGQIIVFYLVIGAFITCGVTLIFLATVVKNVFFGLIVAVLIIAAVIYLIYLIYEWYFAFVSIVCEDKKVFESFSKSFSLVKGCWWRTFGIILLIGIIVQFAISVITTPFSFLFMWNFLSKYFTMAASGFKENNPAFSMEILKSFGFGFGLVLVLTVILNSLISPLFKVVMYFDLRIRKHEFVAETSEPGELSFE